MLRIWVPWPTQAGKRHKNRKGDREEIEFGKQHGEVVQQIRNSIA